MNSTEKVKIKIPALKSFFDLDQESPSTVSSTLYQIFEETVNLLTMTTTIWILKGVIASIFTFTGIYKIFLTKAKLLEKGMKGLIDLDEKQIKVVGLLEVLGAVGLIVPTLLNIFPILSSISALCLSLTMIVAGRIHYKLKLPIIPNIVIFILCILLAYLELKQF